MPHALTELNLAEVTRPLCIIMVESANAVALPQMSPTRPASRSSLIGP